MDGDNKENKEGKDKAAMNGANSALTLTLTKPVTAHGETVTSLAFKEPTVADIEKAGDPLDIEFLPNGGAVWRHDETRMVMMMSALAAVPPSTIRTMSSTDYKAAKILLSRFFIPTVADTSS